jgi:hypothetical protein
MELIVEVALGIILAVVLLALGAVVLAWIMQHWESICGGALILGGTLLVCYLAVYAPSALFGWGATFGMIGGGWWWLLRYNKRRNVAREEQEQLAARERQRQKDREALAWITAATECDICGGNFDPGGTMCEKCCHAWNVREWERQRQASSPDSAVA